MRPIEVAKHLADLEAAGRVACHRHGDGVYYQPAQRGAMKSGLRGPRTGQLDPSEQPQQLEPGMLSNLVIQLDSKSFRAALKHQVLLVDFWEPCCGPCQIQLPVLEEVARRVAGRATIAKVNVDEAQKLAVRFGIESIPTLVLFKDGKVVRQFVGNPSAAALTTAIEAAETPDPTPGRRKSRRRSPPASVP